METTVDTLWRPAHEGEVKFYVDAPFVREVVDDEKGGPEWASKGDVIQTGYSSTWVEDRDGEYVDPHAFDKSLPNFLQKNPIMLWQHDMKSPIGNVKDGSVDGTGLKTVSWQPRPHDNEPDWKWLAYESVRRGIVKTHSIGGYFNRAIEDGFIKIKEVDLMEISTVSIPSNPDSIFEAAVKSVEGGSSRPRLTQKHIDQMMQILGLRPMTDPELRMMNDAQRLERYEMLAKAYRKTGRRPPEFEEWHELAKDCVDSKGRAVLGSAKRVAAFLQRVNGFEPAEHLKRGRTISQKNEERLKKALEIAEKAAVDARGLIDEVIKSANAETDEEEE